MRKVSNNFIERTSLSVFTPLRWLSHSCIISGLTVQYLLVVDQNIIVQWVIVDASMYHWNCYPQYFPALLISTPKCWGHFGSTLLEKCYKFCTLSSNVHFAYNFKKTTASKIQVKLLFLTWFCPMNSTLSYFKLFLAIINSEKECDKFLNYSSYIKCFGGYSHFSSSSPSLYHFPSSPSPLFCKLKMSS